MKFRVCSWLDDDDFRELLKFSHYTGRSGGCSVFEIDLLKAQRNGVDAQDIIDILRAVEADADPLTWRRLAELAEGERTVRVRLEGSEYLLTSKALIGEHLRELKLRGLVRYSKAKGGFLVKPYALLDAITKLREAGFRVVDESGMLSTGELNLEFRGELRPYQREAVGAWLANQARGVVVLPTGAGKTVVAIAAICELSVPTLVIVYTREQLQQWRERITQFTNLKPHEVGAYYGEEKRLRSITVATYQTAYRRAEELRKFKLLVVDEAHHLPAEKFRRIAEEIPAPYRLALSATPERSDGKHHELYSLMGGVVYRKTYAELASQGYVAPYRVQVVRVELDPDEKAKYSELRREYAALAAGRTVEELVRAAAAGDSEARKALAILNEMKKLVALSRAKLRAAKRIVESEVRSGAKVLVFTQYVAQAETTGRVLGAPVLTGETPADKRRLILEGFRRGRFRVLVLTTVGDEGLDIPDADVGVMLSSSGSRRQFIQRLGRLLRPKPGKEARLYIVVARGTLEERQVAMVLNAALIQ